MVDKLISISVLNRDQAGFIEGCLDSLLRQTHRQNEIIVTDNNSSDSSVAIIGKKYPNIKLVQNSINKGYSRAHNECINICNGEYVLFLNTDIILDENFLAETIKVIEQNRWVGLAQGKLYCFNYGKTNKRVLDSTGVRLHKNRRNSDRGFGIEDTGQHEDVEFIFAASGSSLLCRRRMLEDIKMGGEYFDEDFFAYREEVDLAWRAQLAGWQCAYVPKAFAYHYRSYAPDRRKNMPRRLRKLQYRNRYLMLIKNELPLTFAIHLPYILLFETISFLYVLFYEPFLMKTWPDIIRLLPKMLKKRKQIMQRRKTSARSILSLIK